MAAVQHFSVDAFFLAGFPAGNLTFVISDLSQKKTFFTSIFEHFQQ